MSRTHTSPEETQRFHGERVEARQRERTYADRDAEHRAAGFTPGTGHVSLDETPEEFFARIARLPHDDADAALVKAGVLPPKGHPMEGPLLAALLLDIVAHQIGSAPKEPEPQERIDPIDDNEPPFFKFWQKLNDKLTAAGKPEAGYKDARTAFNGGETPAGALTFIGKEWEGLRAISYTLSDGKPAYHGQFREVSDEGTIWRTVHNSYGAIAYTSAEHALRGAKVAKTHSEDHKS